MLKTIVTLGPASAEDEVLASLLDVSDGLRLNASHLDGPGLGAWLERLEGLFSGRGAALPVWVDLQGAKMRIGTYPTRDALPEHVRFEPGEASGDPERIPVPHRIFFDAVEPGDILTLNDARVTVRVEEVDRAGASPRVRARVLVNGPLASNKGLNRREHPLPCLDLTPRDREAVRVAMQWPFTHFAFSFVVDGSEAGLVRPRAPGRRLVAKIERPEAFPNLEAIAGGFDELWLCRGDLGAQAGLERLGPLQEAFAARTAGLGRPCWLAGQVLEHMSHFPHPTRTEIVHLHQVERDGFEGIVLSDETAVGRHPREVARFLGQRRSWA